MPPPSTFLDHILAPEPLSAPLLCLFIRVLSANRRLNRKSVDALTLLPRRRQVFPSSYLRVPNTYYPEEA